MKRQACGTSGGGPTSAGAATLCDLDDALLSKVLLFLDPFPGVANAALTCRRLRRVATDKGRWLVVAPHAVDAAGTPSGRAGPRFTSLAGAVAASRPGDTIWLAPHVRHEAPCVRVRWPLHICGAGAGSTLLASPSGEAALDIGASAKIIGVAIESRLGPCILHRRGTLHVESCALRCDNGGLDHILAPIITAAVSGPAAWAGQHPQQQQQQQQQQQRKQDAPSSPCRSPTGAAAGAYAAAAAGDTAGSGRLAIADTRLEGTSGCGVLCAGTGAVRQVRVVRGSRAAWLFLEVDSAVPGVYAPGARPPPPPFAVLPRGPAAADASGSAGKAAAGLLATETRGPAAGGVPLERPVGRGAEAGLSRINALLGGHAISPALMAAHLARAVARQQGGQS